MLFVSFACRKNPSLSENDRKILDYATSQYDKATTMMHKRVVICENNQTPIVAIFPCGDICPDYMVRVIHYELLPGQKCSDLGGVERKLRVVRGRASNDEIFCFPKVLSDNWEMYIK
jgi:hypothetical protein